MKVSSCERKVGLPCFYTYTILVTFWKQVAAGSVSIRNSGAIFFSVNYISRHDFMPSRLLVLSTIHFFIFC